MGETTITINSDFADEKAATEFSLSFDKSCKANNHDLGNSLNDLFDLEVANKINVESVETEKISIFISCYGGRHIEQPVWFVEALFGLGANRIEITSQCDEDREAFYFIDGRRVNKNKFFGTTNPDYLKQLTQKELDIIYLPKGRTKVDAELIESSRDTGEWSHSYVLKMRTLDGKEFYYRGDSELVNLVHYDDRYEKHCSFVAKFELGKFNGHIVSFAKRPTKIEFVYRESFLKFLPKATCPYCGKTLRTDKAKQCMHCLKSWHDK